MNYVATPQQITYETPLPYNDDDPVPLTPINNKKQRIEDSTQDRPDPLVPSTSTIPRQITQETPRPDNDLLSPDQIRDGEQRFRDTMPIVIDSPPHSTPPETPDAPKSIDKGSLEQIECDADSVLELSNSRTESKTDIESNNEFPSLFQINDEGSGEHTTLTVIEVSDEETEKVAWAHKQAGNLAEASTEYLRLVEKYTQIYGSESVFNLKALSNLAGIYQTQSLLLKSIAAYKTVVHGYERIYGTSALETLQALHSFAKVLEENGDQIEAQSLYRRAIAGFEVLGESGLAPLLNSQHFLGDLLCDKECYTEAEPLLDAAIAGYRSLGLRHLEIVALGSLLEVYNGKRDLWNVKRTISGMRKLFEELIRIDADQNQLPEILIEGIHLANVYSALTEDDDAESLLSRIIPKLELLSDAKYGIEKVYGYMEYGCLYQNQERWEEASDYLHLAKDGLYKLNRHSDPVVRFVEARLMEVRTYSGGAYNRHELSKERLEQVHGGLRRRHHGGSEDREASRGTKSVREEASDTETASCKYGITFSTSEITGVSLSQCYRL